MESCRLIPVPGRRGDVCVLGETVKVSGVVQKKVCPLRPAARSWGGQPFVFSGTKITGFECGLDAPRRYANVFCLCHIALGCCCRGVDRISRRWPIVLRRDAFPARKLFW